MTQASLQKAQTLLLTCTCIPHLAFLSIYHGQDGTQRAFRQFHAQPTTARLRQLPQKKDSLRQTLPMLELQIIQCLMLYHQESTRKAIAGSDANRYEQSIADLNHKIQKLTEALHTPSEDSHTSPVVENPPCVNISSHHEIISGRQTSLADKSNSFEGDSSFAVHSQQATRAFEASLASTPQMQIDEALSGAMANLQKALDSSRARASSPACSGEFVDDKKSQDLSSLPMPPSDLVLRMLKLAKSKSQTAAT